MKATSPGSAGMCRNEARAESLRHQERHEKYPHCREAKLARFAGRVYCVHLDCLLVSGLFLARTTVPWPLFLVVVLLNRHLLVCGPAHVKHPLQHFYKVLLTPEVVCLAAYRPLHPAVPLWTRPRALFPGTFLVSVRVRAGRRTRPAAGKGGSACSWAFFRVQTWLKFLCKHSMGNECKVTGTITGTRVVQELRALPVG